MLRKETVEPVTLELLTELMQDKYLSAFAANEEIIKISDLPLTGHCHSYFPK